MAQLIESETLEVRARVLGVLLHEARQTAGKSVRELAHALGCSTARVRAYEFGDKSPTLPELELAALCLQVPLGHFFDERPLGGGHYRIDDPQSVVALRQSLIGALLQQARVQAQRSLRSVGRGIGITPQMLRKFELGDRPVPVPLLEALAFELGVGMNYFRDGAPEEFAAWDRTQENLQRFLALPEDLQAFVIEPLNRQYVETAMHLSAMPAARLRAIAEALLDITY